MDKGAELLVDSVYEIEKYNSAIPEMKPMLELGGAYYIAGSLVLNIPDKKNDRTFTCIDIEPINDYASNIIREAMYIASQIFVKNKDETCHSYDQALSNIREYEDLIKHKQPIVA